MSPIGRIHTADEYRCPVCRQVTYDIDDDCGCSGRALPEGPADDFDMASLDATVGAQPTADLRDVTNAYLDLAIARPEAFDNQETRRQARALLVGIVDL